MFGATARKSLSLLSNIPGAALTALLVAEQCGVFEYRRVVHDTRLGLDGVQDGSEASWSDLERAVREITELPLKYGSGAGLKHISNVVLLGESAGDSRMQNAVRNVLAERYNSLATADGAIQPPLCGRKMCRLVHLDSLKSVRGGFYM